MRVPGGGRLLPGCGTFGVRRFPTPHHSSFRACGRGPIPTGCGCGGSGRGDLSPTPQRALLRAGFARCGGRTRAPGGGASCLGAGRPRTGALPPPTSRPFGRAAGARFSLAVGAGGAGVGARLSNKRKEKKQRGGRGGGQAGKMRHTGKKAQTGAPKGKARSTEPKETEQHLLPKRQQSERKKNKRGWGAANQMTSKDGSTKGTQRGKKSMGREGQGKPTPPRLRASRARNNRKPETGGPSSKKAKKTKGGGRGWRGVGNHTAPSAVHRGPESTESVTHQGRTKMEKSYTKKPKKEEEEESKKKRQKQGNPSPKGAEQKKKSNLNSQSKGKNQNAPGRPACLTRPRGASTRRHAQDMGVAFPDQK